MAQSYGVAQPTKPGLRTVLAALGCTTQKEANRVAWICTREEPIIYIAGRPYCLREAAQPKRNLSISQRAENLESIEARLKEDILKEAGQYHGVILVHEETGNDLIPMWIAAHDIMTSRELFEAVAGEGCPLEYHRVPIASDQDPSDNYVDRFVHILRTLPLEAAVVFNCGMGAVRTTYATSAALILRRRQHILKGGEDPFTLAAPSRPVTGDSLKNQAVQGLQQLQDQRDRSRNLLLLMSLMQEGKTTSLLPTTSLAMLTVLELKSATALVDVVASHPSLLEQLNAALAGRYELMLSLVSCLEDGQLAKQLVDRILDENAAVVHLRHQILVLRLQYVSNAVEEAEKKIVLRRALKALERYLFLVSFAAYVEESEEHFQRSFYAWVGERHEIRNMIRRMRSTKQLFVFAPVHDLSAIGAAEANQVSAFTNLGKSRYAAIVREGGELAGDEWAKQMVNNRSGNTLRSGTILKLDVWRQAGAEEGHEHVRGTTNFRKIHNTELWALAQPAEDGIGEVLEHIAAQGDRQAPVWINLREEPVVYINGSAYVLRESGVSLRNMQSYAGISSSRIESIEERLVADILTELQQNSGRLLLHTEQADGTIVPIWEHVREGDVKTLRQVMTDQAKRHHFEYRRIPMTAERSPDLTDLDEILRLVVGTKSADTPIVVNCQLGRGRSTMASIAIYLIRQWLGAGGKPNAFVDRSTFSKPLAYKVIGNLLRLMPHGKDVKSAVDTAVRDCNELVDLVDAIEKMRQRAERAEGNKENENSAVKDGLHNLHRYFNLILFAAYLNQLEGDTAKSLKSSDSFEQYVASKPVFATVEKEIDAGGRASLTPLEQAETDVAEDDRSREIVLHRNGQILSQSTMLKSDLFLGLQKLSLPERIDGAANFRVANLALSSGSGGVTPSDEKPKFAMKPITGGNAWVQDTEHAVYGTGMPTQKGIRAVLQRMQAGPNGEREIVWTSMREEPVLYVSGKPYVLRLLDEPMENVITTGVTADAVENQERKLKDEVLREAKHYDGKILLHDEIEESGSFKIVAQWETVDQDSILTPLELFEGVIKDGYRVDYGRVPVTDEQAPIPGVFSKLEERIRAALAKGSSRYIFNCQMGRGRTTTGMVACTLIYNILKPPSLGQKMKRRLSSSFVLDQRVPAQPAQEQSTSQWGDERETAMLQRGEYRMILQLVSLLPNGKLAKRLTDQAINQCDAVQNLRKAILDYRLRADSASPGRSKDRLRDVTKSYLFRYGLLIAFAGYLLDKADAEEEQADLDFPKWLEKREIPRLLSQTEDDLS